MNNWLKDTATGGHPAAYALDGFGLPIKPQSAETAHELQWRQAVTKREGEMVVHALFRKLQLELGDLAARKLFAPYVIEPKKKPGSHGKRDPYRSAYLILLYDQLSEGSTQVEQLPRIISAMLDREIKGKYGNSAAAIEKQIRRLLKERRNESASRKAVELSIEEALASIVKALGGGDDLTI